MALNWPFSYVLRVGLLRSSVEETEPILNSILMIYIIVVFGAVPALIRVHVVVVLRCL